MCSTSCNLVNNVALLSREMRVTHLGAGLIFRDFIFGEDIFES